MALPGIQSFWTGPGAIENGVAPIQPERVFKIVEPLVLRFVTAVRQPAPRLQQHRRTEEAITVPPMARTSEVQQKQRIHS